jgi:hypothetical protein
MLDRPTRQIITAAGRAAGVSMQLINAALTIMEESKDAPFGTSSLLVNQATAARLLAVSRFTIRRLASDGQLSPVLVRGAVRYPLDQIQRLAGSGRVLDKPPAVNHG